MIKCPMIAVVWMLLASLVTALPAKATSQQQDYVFEGGSVRVMRDGRNIFMLVTPAPGFKTYAPNPGPSGLSPELIQEGRALSLEASVPKRFYLTSGDAYLGYDSQALFRAPFLEEQAEVEAYLGFCEELCLPASFVFLPSQLQEEQMTEGFVFPEYVAQPVSVDRSGFVRAPSYPGAEVFVADPPNYSDLHGQLNADGQGNIKPWPKELVHELSMIGMLWDGRLIFAPTQLER